MGQRADIPALRATSDLTPTVDFVSSLPYAPEHAGPE